MLHFLLSIGEWFADTWDKIRITFIEEELIRLEKELDEVGVENSTSILNEIDAHETARQKIQNRIQAREIRHNRKRAAAH